MHQPGVGKVFSYLHHAIRELVAFSLKIRERKESVTVLLCGTSGRGKSTLSALLDIGLVWDRFQMTPFSLIFHIHKYWPLAFFICLPGIQIQARILLGIMTVISTDSIRHMLRSFVDEKKNPLVWASTYHAGEYLDAKAVAAAKAKRTAKKLAGVSRPLPKDDA
ncbi:hypothetical protein ACSBR2_010942 [Camellia fascicularis]